MPKRTARTVAKPLTNKLNACLAIRYDKESIDSVLTTAAIQLDQTALEQRPTFTGHGRLRLLAYLVGAG